MYTNDPIKSEALRLRAYQRLGGAPSGDVRQGTIAALDVLHELASSPASASDALALLQELQVHQVELAVQDEDLRASVAELEGELRRQQQREELAPIALFGVDHRSTVLEINRAGAELLACPAEDALGKQFASYIQVEDRPGLLAAMQAHAPRGARPQLRLHLCAADGRTRIVLVGIAADPSLAQRFRVAVMSLDVAPE